MKSMHSCFILPIIFFFLAPQAGAQWSSNTSENNEIARTTNEQRFPQTVSDGDGGAIIVWEDNRNGFFFVYAQRIDKNGMIRWAPNGVAVSPGLRDQTEVSVLSDGNGGVFLAWSDMRNDNADIFAQHLDKDGKRLWKAGGVRASSNNLEQRTPVIASDGAGGIIIAWSEFLAGNQGATDDLYAQRINASGQVMWGADGAPICTAPIAQRHPGIASDGNGGAIIAWSDGRNNNSYSIYAQRVSGGGGTYWLKDGIAVSLSSGTLDWPKLVGDGSGGAVLVWTDDSGNIHSQRLDGAGKPRWTISGKPIGGSAGDQSNPFLVRLGNSFIVAWDDTRNGNADIYVQKIAMDGTSQWFANGLLVCNATGDQQYPSVTPDGAGGIILAWQDYRAGSSSSGTKRDIYVQRLTSGGTPLWTNNGVVVCNAKGNQYLPTLATDGNQGAIVAWEDYRDFNSKFDIYAMRILKDGTFPIAPPTVKLSTKNIMFGDVNVGLTASESFTITNSGGKDLVISNIASSAQEFFVQPTSGSLKPGESMSVTVEYTPPGAGDHNGTVTVTSNSPTSPDVVTVSGTGVLASGLQVNPKLIAFGDVPVSGRKDTTVTLTNSGAAPLNISSINSTNPAFSVQPTSMQISPGQSKNITVRFAPASTGFQISIMLIHSDSPSSPDTIKAMGTGKKISKLAIDVTAHDFGKVKIGESKDLRFRLSNTGNFRITIDSIVSSHPAFKALTTQYSMVSGKVVFDTIRFTPVEPGMVSATVTIYGDYIDAPFTIAVQGSGEGTPKIQFGSRRVSFGTVEIGKSRDTTVTITNIGTDTLKVTEIRGSRSDFSARPTAFTLPPGDSIVDTLSFRPTGTGNITGFFTFASNAVVPLDTIYAEGTGSPPVSVDDPGAARRFSLGQNYPNPLGGSAGGAFTAIPYEIARRSAVELAIYSSMGKKVATLVHGTLDPGRYVARWSPQRNATGIYFCRLTVNGVSKTISIVLDR